MKKYIYMITIILTMFIGVDVVWALDYKNMNAKMEEAIVNNEWKLSTEISADDGSYYGIKVLVGNINSDSELKEIYNDVGKIKLGSITVSACDDSTNCSAGSDAYIRFGLQKADSDGNIYLYASGISDGTYKKMENAKYFFTTAITNGEWIKGESKSTNVIENNVAVDDNRDYTLGGYENPFVINGSGSFTITYPSYKYYFKIIAPDGKKYGRYKVDPSSIGNEISTHIVGNNYSQTETCADDKEGMIVFYSGETYYIELSNQNQLMNETIMFTYIDDDKSNMCGGEIAKDPSKNNDTEDKDDNYPITSGETIKLIKQIYNIIKIIIPVLIIGLSIVDFLKVILISDDKNYKSAWDKFTKRLIIGVIFFLVPLLVSFLLNISGMDIGEQSFLEIFK